MQLRYLKPVTLCSSERIKQENGEKVLKYKDVQNYNVQIQNIEDEVSASIYGSDITKMLRLKSPNKKLENYLIPKVNNREDNISNYFIKVNGSIYKVSAVTESKIDIERL